MDADIVGAVQSGMQAALIRRPARSYPEPSLGALHCPPDLRIASLGDLLNHLGDLGKNR